MMCNLNYDLNKKEVKFKLKQTLNKEVKTSLVAFKRPSKIHRLPLEN